MALPTYHFSLWWSVFMLLSPGLDLDEFAASANTTATSNIFRDCDPAMRLTEFTFPIVDKGHRSPQEHLPYGVMLDFFLRSHFDPTVKSVFGEPGEWYKIPNIHPCLRVGIKLLPNMDSARETMIHQNLYFYLDSSDLLSNSTIPDMQTTHTAFYGMDPNVHTRAGLKADALEIIHVSPNGVPDLSNKKLYPNFFRAAPSVLYVFQPMWGFYTLYGWRAVMVMYSVEARMQALFRLFVESASIDRIPSAYIVSAPLSMSVPFQVNAIFTQLQRLRAKPIRIVFHFVASGLECKAKLGSTFLDRVMELQVEIGLWMPTYQMVSGREFHQASMFQNATRRSMVGLHSHGSFFFAESHLELPSTLAARLQGFFWWFGKAGQLGAVDLKMHDEQARYGLHEWSPAILQLVLQRFDDAGGLPGLLSELPVEHIQVNWFKTDIAMRQVMAHDCFLKKGGNLTVRDASLFRECLTMVSHKSEALMFDMAYDSNQELENTHYMMGPVYVMDNTTNTSEQVWFNPVVWVERGVHNLSGCSKAGRFLGYHTPVWGNGAQSDNAPKDLLKCTSGMVQNMIGSCDWCPIGRYSSTTYDAKVCSPCPHGRFAAAPSSTCNSCPPGSEARENSSARCDLCLPGSYSETSASSECTYCQIGAFSSKSGSTACEKCGRSFTTENIASQQQLDCLCPRGRYPADGTCHDCMEGLVCGEGTAFLMQNYYALESRPYEVYFCRGSTTGCSGGPPQNCNKGFSGFMCAQCSESRSRIVNGHCERCIPDVTMWLIILAIFLVVLFCLSTVQVLGNAGRVFGNAEHMQDIAAFLSLITMVLYIFDLLQELGIDFSFALFDLLEVLASVFTWNINKFPWPFPLACVLGESVVEQYMLQVLFICSPLAMAAAAHFMVSVVTRSRNDRLESSSKLYNVVGQLAQMQLVVFSGATLRPLQCYQHPNGEESVVMYPQLLCWNNHDHISLASLGKALFALFVLPYIAFCAWACWTLPAKLFKREDPDDWDTWCLQRSRFLFRRLHAHCWWWSFASVLRQVLVPLAIVVSSRHARVQLFHIESVLVIYGCFAVMFWPWMSREHNVLDCGISLMLSLLLMWSSQFLSDASDGGHASLWALFVALFCIILWYLISSAMRLGKWCNFQARDERPDITDLSQQWVVFLEAAGRQSAEDAIKTWERLSPVECWHVLSVIHSWSTMSKPRKKGREAPSFQRIEGPVPVPQPLPDETKLLPDELLRELRDLLQLRECAIEGGARELASCSV